MFSIDNFNIISDNDNYYFFRALNNGDHKDIENGITSIRTNRERYTGTPKYNEDSTISLEEVINHIKYDHRTDTNCISLTSNANVGIMYGREYYHDEYIIVKVPKNELGKSTYLASLYITDEIEKFISNQEVSDLTKYYFDLIDNISSQEKLDELMSKFKEENDDIFERGIEYDTGIKSSIDYSALSKSQNLEKNKLIAKINILGINIIPGISNKLLIQTLAGAISSSELIHYKSIKKDELISCPKEIMDIFALLQQIDHPLVGELQLKLINYLNKPNNLASFKYNDYNLSNEDYNIDTFYNITNGSIDYHTINNIYHKVFYLAKSKLRSINSINLLKSIINDSKYDELYKELINKTYGVEVNIFTRRSIDRYGLLGSIGLDITKKELDIFNLVDKLSTSDLEYIINNSNEAIKIILPKLFIERHDMSKEEYFANAIIDTFDWKKLNVVYISPKQRKHLIDKLISSNCVELYYSLKNEGVKESNIASRLLTSVIKNRKVSSNEEFSIEELEHALGYYKLKDYKLQPRGYQTTAILNIEKEHKLHNFVAAIMPTGSGKSFVALVEMLKYKDKEILYLAPNDTILNQIEDYIFEYILGYEGTFGISPQERRKKVKKAFPGLRLENYANLTASHLDIIEHKYDFIVMDELHRTGAKEWNKWLTRLLDYQDSNVKVLGITATPTRDCDGVDMADYWAKYYGYTESEIARHKHLAMNMDIMEAIKYGYVTNLKVVSCAYNLLNNELEDLHRMIEFSPDETTRNELQKKYEGFRRQVENADGVEKILQDNLKKGKRYIVFCPKNNGKEKGIEVIEKYQKLLDEYLGEENIECFSMLGSYSKSINRRQLELFENNNKPDKITFMVVMDKLNEGSHAKNDGLIWFRAIDEDSLILTLQQGGRPIRGLAPGEVVKEEDLPIAIDLTNNLLRLHMNKKFNSAKITDLDKLKVVVGWVTEHNKIPDINSNDKVESSHASILKYIQKKYSKYLDTMYALDITNEEREEILEILELGTSIDLWNYPFPNRIKKESDKEKADEVFGLTGIMSDFLELKGEIESKVTYTFEDKLREYLTMVEFEKKLVGVSEKYRDYKFSDNTKMSNFWNRNKEKIMEMISLESGTYDEEYPVACNILRKEYSKSKSKITLSPEEKLKEYLEEVTRLGRLVPQSSSVIFSDNTQMGKYWMRDKEKIMEMIGLERGPYDAEYSKACKILRFEYTKEESKLKEYLGEITKTGRLVSHSSSKLFSNGEQMANYWKINRDNIIQIIGIESGQYDLDYSEACMIIRKAYEYFLNKKMNKKEKKLLSPEEKLKEYLQEVTKIGEVVKQSSALTFSNDEKMGNYFIAKKRRKIMKLLGLESGSYDEEYPNACKILREEYNKKNLSFDEKLIEYLKEVEKEGRKIPKRENKQFTDSTQMGTYWSANKEKIMEMIGLDNGPYDEEYPTSCQILREEYKEYLKSKDKDVVKLKLSPEEKLIEYLEEVEKERKIIPFNSDKQFTDSTQIGTYWNTNKDKMIEMIGLYKGPYDEEYSKACEILRNAYREYLNKKKEKEKAKEEFSVESKFSEVKDKVDSKRLK